MTTPVRTRTEVLERILEAEAEIRDLGVRRLALFGSFARSEARPDSDADLLVEFAPGQKSFDRFNRLYDLLEERLARRVELVTTESLSPYIGPHILARRRMSFQPRDYAHHILDEADMPAQDQPDPGASMPDADLLARITFRPEQCGGRPCIRGMRIRVSDVLSLLAAGAPEAEILADYPYLEREDIAACLLYAARRVDHPRFAA